MAGHLNIGAEFFPEWDRRKQAGDMLCFKKGNSTLGREQISSYFHRDTGGGSGWNLTPPPHLGFHLNCPALKQSSNQGTNKQKLFSVKTYLTLQNSRCFL